ncbi:DNA cytosine methyltransferase [Acidovorax sp.]|uniref:DNA cytosine methyltransferase n=1 Tax=Acidovorax sp. TaxID=1872122 RepID=UPI0025C71D24|nr:DNA cytosine methyltransferase [Acidovorax sp.]MCI5068434.1 DNA cytosine methyltransferase [Acidovorax sp.]
MALHSIELCAGVGMLGEGVRAAFEFLGIEHRTVCYVEREAAAAAQLACLMEAGAIDPAPVWSDLLTFDGAAWRGLVDFIIAGFPCQDISIAGRRAGLDGARSGLFFDILDIADDCGALGLILENVSAIATATASAVDEAEGSIEERAAARVVGELADRGWDTEWITLSASDVGAGHGRARWFCIAWRRVADTGHGPRAHQPLDLGGSDKPAHDSAGSKAVDDAQCAQRWSLPSTRTDRIQGQNEFWREADGGPGVAVSQLDDPDCAGLATVDEYGRVRWIVADAECARRPQAGRRSDVHSGWEFEPGCGVMANPGEPRLPDAEQPGKPGEPQAYGRRAAPKLRGTPLFAPGPLDPRWASIVTHRPDLAPAVEPGIRMLADGMAYLVDESRAHQLRQVGNGVVPLQAAVALVELLRRARGCE